MTQEKELLLKDICGRLRSGIICSIYREDDEGFGWRDSECKGYFQNNGSYEFYFEDVIAVDNIERLKPYLRPMSSMTEEEKSELKEYLDAEEVDCNGFGYTEGGTLDDYVSSIPYSLCSYVIDFLNAHHFDYRGLIEKGLALEAPKDMYNTKTE